MAKLIIKKLILIISNSFKESIESILVILGISILVIVITNVNKEEIITDKKIENVSIDSVSSKTNIMFEHNILKRYYEIPPWLCKQ